MVGVLSKPADQVDIHDVETLMASQVPEGEQIEYKESLCERGRNPDPWMNGNHRISDRARNKILEEAVAFANAHGGVLLLGIRESSAKPPVAAAIAPIPRCAELAERLKLVFRDCVEPHLPQLEVFAVHTEDRSGVIIIRVGRSRQAPHRIGPTLVCPIRRSDRCEKMTMREIQDMTLNVSRGLERLEIQLSRRCELFQREFDPLITPESATGIRITALPIGDEIEFDRILRRGKLIDELAPP